MLEMFVSLSMSVLIFLITVIALSLVMRKKLYIKERIKRVATKNENIVISPKKKRVINISKRLAPLFKAPILKLLANELLTAGIHLRPDEFLIIWIMTTLIPAAFVFAISEQFIVALSFAICGFVAPIAFLKISKAKRLGMLDKQLVNALMIIGNCLRAGLTLQQAMESIARNMPEPISKEFDRVLREIKFGVTIEKALSNMVERLKNKDVNLLVSAILIQRQVGGNLSEIIESIASTIKERVAIKEEVKVLTATGRTSGIVVGLLPVGAFLILMILNPQYIEGFFKSELGTILLVIAGGMEIIGFAIVNKISNIKF